MVRRAQVSLEFLMIVGIAMLIMTASTYFVFDFTQSNNDQSGFQQAAQVGYTLVDEAVNMYVYGQGSFITLTGSMPQNIHDAYIVENQTLVFELTSQQGIVPVYIFSDVPINGTQAQGDRVLLTEPGTSVHPGNTQFRVESMGDWIQIRQVS